MKFGALALTLAACGHAATKPIATPPATPPPATPLPEVSTTQHVPTVEFDGRIDVVGLPAIADDGSYMVVAHQDSDGGRGNPNLTLVAIDRNDKKLKSLVVLTVEDSDKLADKPDAIRARFDLANRWLAKLASERRLIALQPMSAETLPITWVKGRLRVVIDGATVLDRASPPTWVVPDEAMYKGSTDKCSHPARIETGYIDAKRRLAMIQVAYEGSDMCWEPSAQEHVISW